MRDVKILELEEDWLRRKSKRPPTYMGKPALNRDIGQQLPPFMIQLVSRDASHVTQPGNSVR